MKDKDLICNNCGQQQKFHSMLTFKCPDGFNFFSYDITKELEE